MLSDIEIARSSKMLHIKEVAKKINIDEDDLELYGKYKAKLSEDFIKSLKDKKNGKLVLVTAINPTPLGEGKTTISIGLAEALNKLNKKAIVAIREPSLGPCFGIKGGAAGGGYSQALPMDELNLHFTGDFHAITSANNLLAALLDNHIHQGNELNIDTKNIVFKRCLDMNDRALRQILIALGSKANGTIREDSFNITVASEIMAILCLSENIYDLKNRLSKIIVAYNKQGEPIFAKDLNAVGSMAVLLKDAIKPNLIQTIENNPVLVHGGPFANIAHGCNSVRATKIGLKLSDICITEAGFGADLGAEKFFDIKCRQADLKPDAVVLVVTTRALKYNAGIDKKDLEIENINAIKNGVENLEKHIDNIQSYGLPVLVCINSFITDSIKEYEIIRELCSSKKCEFAISNVWEKGGAGGIDLGKKLLNILENKKSDFKLLYPLDLSIKEKIKHIALKIYGANDVIYSDKANKNIDILNRLLYNNLPICIAKTPYSFSDDSKKLGRPKNFDIHINDIYVSLGAGFIVALTENIMTMPGLPKHPAANNIDINDKGEIIGLF